MDYTNIQNTIEAWGEKITGALKAAIPPGKDSSGALARSISFSINYAGFPVVFELQLADYYKFIDEGRKPGKFPPPDVIMGWIKNKQLTITQKSSLKQNTNKSSAIPPDQRMIKSLSYLVGRKIARDGISPTDFYSNTLSPDALLELQNNLSEAFKQDVLVQLSINNDQ